MSFWISFERNPLYFCFCKTFFWILRGSFCYPYISILHLLKVSPTKELKVCAGAIPTFSLSVNWFKNHLPYFLSHLNTIIWRNKNHNDLYLASSWIILKVVSLAFSILAIDAGVFTKLLKWVVVNLMDIMNREDSQGKGPGLSSNFKNFQMKPRTFSRIFAGIHERLG